MVMPLIMTILLILVTITLFLINGLNKKVINLLESIAKYKFLVEDRSSKAYSMFESIRQRIVMLNNRLGKCFEQLGIKDTGSKTKAGFGHIQNKNNKRGGNHAEKY
jgi:hypothetical protein